MASFNPSKLKVVKNISRREILFALARVPNTNRIFVGGSDFAVSEIDLSQDKPTPRELGKHQSYVTSLTLAGPAEPVTSRPARSEERAQAAGEGNRRSGAARVLVSGGYDGRLLWWDADKGKQIRAIEAHSRWIRDLTSTPDGKVIVSVADDMVCKLWDAGTGKLIRELRGHKEKTPNHFGSMLFTCTVSADGKYLATADKVGHIVVWETATGKQLASVEAPLMYTWDPRQRKHSIGGVRSLAFSPDSKLLAAGGIGQIGNVDHLGAKARVEIFDWSKGKRTHEYPGDKFKGLVERLVFHPSGDILVAAGGDHNGFLMFFDLNKKKPIRQDKAPMHVHDFAINESWNALYAVGHGRIAQYQM